MARSAASLPGWVKDFKKLFPQGRVREPLAPHTTFRIGGPADFYLEVRRLEDLKRLLEESRSRSLPLFVLGFGSNLLVLDRGVRGVVVRLRGEFESIKFLGGGAVHAGAAVRLPKLSTACAEKGLCGTESLVGVPGTVGGALVMNAGTRDGEIGPLVCEVEVLEEGELVRLSRPRLEFRYRSSNLADRFVVGATLELKPGDKVDIIKRIRGFQKRRAETQPIHTYNVGSVFKNPPGHFVAKLIEGAGLKGARCGGAKVSELHANFIENDKKASARDVLGLVDKIRAAVRESSGIELELEMKVVGEA